MNLVLGHGHNYDIPRCLTISKDEWNKKRDNKQLLYIDNDEECNPDIVLDLETRWNMFPDDYTDTIIDTTGLGSWMFNKLFWDEVYRVLKPGGCMFSRRKTNVICSSSDYKRSKFEMEIVSEYVIKYIKPV